MYVVVNSVFRTTELLEAILLHLHPEQLLFAQRVSRVFRSPIIGSTRLRKRLFLLPDLLNEGNQHLRLHEYTYNSLFAGFPHSDGQPTYFKCGEIYLSLTRIDFLTLHQDIYTLDPIKAKNFAIPGIRSNVRDCKYQLSAGDRAFKCGSWEGMYLCQPTCNIYVGMVLPNWKEIGFQTETPGTMGGMMVRAIKLLKLHVLEDAW